MYSIKCHKCGKKISVADDCTEVQCPYCHSKTRITSCTLSDIIQHSYNLVSAQITTFTDHHPKIVQAVGISAFTAFGIWLLKEEWDAATRTQSYTPADSEPNNSDLICSSSISCNPMSSTDVVVQPEAPFEETLRTEEERHLLDRLRSGDFDGDFCEPLLNNGYGSSLQLQVRNGIPCRVKYGPGGKFFNGEENESWSSTPHIDTRWRTDDQKLFFFKKYGFLSQDEEAKAYSAKFKGKV